MAQRQIEIEPGTESWGAWIEHHKGTKTELVMVRCRHDARPFYAWTEFPPERARGDKVSLAKPAEAAKPATERAPIPEGAVDAIADRLLARAERDGVETSADVARREKLRRIEHARERAAAAVQSGYSPNLEDLDDVGIRMIDDPFEVKRGRKPKPLRAKLVNLRDDPVGQMAKREQITSLQLQAARHWQALHDVAAGVGGSRAIDPSAMKVDGGRFSDPINDLQIGSIKQLQQIDMNLGHIGATLVRRVLGERMTVAQVAVLLGEPCETERQRQRESERLGWRLRECLDTLVDCMGLNATGARRRIPRQYAETAALAQYADNPPLHRAVKQARSKIV